MFRSYRAYSVLASVLMLTAACSYQSLSTPPGYSEQTLRSLCDHGAPLQVENRGVFDSVDAHGYLMLAAQLTRQPPENWLEYHAMRLEYLPDTGLHVTVINLQGEEESELLPADWITCTDNAMELRMPSDAFYVWASVGVHMRRLRLQVTPDAGLVLQALWEEKGMAAVVFPVKFSGDSWALFARDEPASHVHPPPPPTFAAIGDCQDLSGDYSPDGTSVAMDGVVDYRSAASQFFRSEIVGKQQEITDGPAPVALRIAHASDGGLVVSLVRADGTQIDRQLDADRLACEQGRWLAKGKKEMGPALMLLVASGGARWEDLQISRDRQGALLVHGIYRSRAVLFLIPTGSTEELLMRFKSLPDSGVVSPPAVDSSPAKYFRTH
ncbi:MAG: hypothetical protein MUO39_02890 [Steroidobacteraceae bacterium]|nr:hypothetical protein [Steroidobacteraceae bacterium]